MNEEIFEYLEARTIEDECDALADLIYFAIGTFVEMGVQGSYVFDIVHQHNMRKDGGGKAEDGKQLKPSSWEQPEEAIYNELITQGLEPEEEHDDSI